MTNKSEAWKDDRLGRKDQSDAIIKYLITRSKNRRLSGLANGFVLAIESEYGQGKSYFVRNMKMNLSNDHPVCLIDAWTDDRIDSPFLAILDGIENALEPFFDTDSKIRETAEKLLSNSGRLASSFAKGMSKKIAEKAVGAGVEEMFHEALESDENNSDDDENDMSDVAAEGVKESIERIDKLSDSATAKGLKEYRQQKLSMHRLRKRLAILSEQINVNETHSLPIFVFIDELDRCRPDYAIKLLEEVKHLFDIPGFVFVLSLQKKQLLNAIGTVYGSEFEADAYLDRFVDKYYVLDTPSCLDFIDLEMEREPFGDDAFLPDCLGLSNAKRISLVFNHYGLSLRETERALDILRASVILIGKTKVDPIFLSMQVIKHMSIPNTRKRRPREAFESIDIEWINYKRLTQSVRAKGKLQKLEDLMHSLSQYASWSNETVKQQIHHIDRPEQYYAHFITQKFYEQFEYNQPESVNMASVCHQILTKVKPFVFSE